MSKFPPYAILMLFCCCFWSLRCLLNFEINQMCSVALVCGENVHSNFDNYQKIVKSNSGGEKALQNSLYMMAMNQCSLLI